jgi:nicotinate-nucleotide pyrophosphorylase (carboxylating)
MRILEKWAVTLGGGYNHRFGLYDMIMLKDNHVDYAGGISAAVSRTRKYLKEKGLNLKVEVETRNLEEVKEALGTGAVDRIMLDNFTVPDMRPSNTLPAGAKRKRRAAFRLLTLGNMLKPAFNLFLLAQLRIQ